MSYFARKNPIISIFAFILIIEVIKSSNYCEDCSKNPCGCSLFPCSKSMKYPTDAGDITFGFKGCMSADGVYID